jgi:DNA helicase-2/ATP-dependent DNA helicase PcrA
MIRFHAASSLPVDQLILTIGQDLFTTPADLALVHKFALLLEFSAANHPEYRLANFADDLRQIAANERRFLGFTDEDTGINPEQHKGEVFVLTYHKAKGLEWDRVYLLSVNNYDFPSAQEGDEYFSEKWFINGRQNLEADLLAKLKTLMGIEEFYDDDDQEPTMRARLEYSAERLRLFYVGITRAKESLIITWNTGKFEKSTMSLPLQAMLTRMEEKRATT